MSLDVLADPEQISLGAATATPTPAANNAGEF
jgi:hypothetical protein